MKLSELRNGQVVHYRLGRYREDLIEPDWKPWTDGPIYVARRTEPLPAKLRKRTGAPNVGDIITMTPMNCGWAEYNQADYESALNTWCVEDYYMQIEGLTL